MNKKIFLGTTMLIVSGVIVSHYSSPVHSAKQGELGVTSTCSFTVSLRINPCVKPVEPPDNDDSGDLCFNTPGLDTLEINPNQCSSNTLVIKPSNNQFCISKEDAEELIYHSTQEGDSCKFDIMTVKAEKIYPHKHCRSL